MSVTISSVIPASPDEVYAWFYDCTNYEDSVMVLRCRPDTPGALGVGSTRTVTMVGGVYHEEITDTQPQGPQRSITYRVVRSVPPGAPGFYAVASPGTRGAHPGGVGD